MNLLQAEASLDVSASTPTNILALCKQLVVLVSTGKVKEAIGVELLHKQVERLTDKKVEKYEKRMRHMWGKNHYNLD